MRRIMKFHAAFLSTLLFLSLAVLSRHLPVAMGQLSISNWELPSVSDGRGIAQEVATTNHDRVYPLLKETTKISSTRQAQVLKELTVRCVSARNLKSLDWGFPSMSGDEGAQTTLERAYDRDGELKAEVVTSQNWRYVRVFFRNAMNPGDVYTFSWEMSFSWDYDNHIWKSSDGTSRIFYELKLRVIVPNGFDLLARTPKSALLGDQDGCRYAELSLANVTSGDLAVLYYPPPKGPVETPLIQTRWGQTGLHALKSPWIHGEHVRVGCWSTAIGQIVNLHRLESSGKIQYNCSNGIVIKNDLDARIYNWSRMAIRLTEVSPTEEVEEVSTFLYDVATVIQKDFDTGTYVLSSAKMTAALQKHFRCKSETITTKELGQTIKDYIAGELCAGRPCMLYFENVAKTTGHAVVVDGWKREGDVFLVHLNMGWEGKSDGWYDFDKPVAEFNDLNYRLILSIRPRDHEKTTQPTGPTSRGSDTTPMTVLRAPDIFPSHLHPQIPLVNPKDSF